ncbi:MAG: rRNA maturation RNase YbeY [Flavobacteriales bacterium]|nr:rRNA maturation RNase YbeY [Flavobacteriales bacterium]
MSLVIDNRQDKIEIKDELIGILEKVVVASLEYEALNPNYEVSLSFVDNDEIQSLNKLYRGKDYATDVLSFPMEDDEFANVEEILLGDIVISVEKAVEQAKEYKHSFEREMAFLTVHSMFHLMGYDHMDKEEEKEMRAKEEAILNKLGIERK